MNSEDDIEVLNQIVRLIQPLSAERRIRLVKTLSTLLAIDNSYSWPPIGSIASDALTLDKPNNRVPYSQELASSPKQFLLEKQPRTDVERVACLAYYLTHYRDTPHFKTIDLSKLNTEAAQPRLSNANYATKNALTYGYLAQASKGQRQLSAAGEQFVNALPDRVTAKTVMTNLLRKRQRKRPSSKPTSKAGAKKSG
jgi:hypothetical protein